MNIDKPKIDYGKERNGTTIFADQLFWCPECNRAWEHVRRMGPEHFEGIPSYGLPRKTCQDCGRWWIIALREIQADAPNHSKKIADLLEYFKTLERSVYPARYTKEGEQS